MVREDKQEHGKKRDRKRKVIAGLGATGLSYARFLSQAGDDFIVMDDFARPERVNALHQINRQAEVIGFEEDILLAAEEILVSPGVPLSTPGLQAARNAGVALRGDVAMFGELSTAGIVAITGTNGKSTVAELVYQMATAQMDNVRIAGNIGMPCLDVLEDSVALYVLEVSSYQLELAPALKSDVAVLLNLSPDHLDRYESVAAYYETKLALYSNCRVAVVNRDLGLKVSGRERRVTFGKDAPPTEDDFGLSRQADTDVLVQGSRALLTSGELPLPGRHNQLNVLAALAVGREIGLDLDAMLTSVKHFQGLPHRSEIVAEADGVTFVNDSKATNPGATLASVKGHQSGKNIILILGGEAKDVSFRPLVNDLAHHVKLALLIGAAREEINRAIGDDSGESAADGPDRRIPCIDCGTLDNAVRTAAEAARQGDLVLLAPGCASFDMFADYAERGNTFKRLVREVIS